MVLTSHLCFIIVIASFIEISPSLAWILNDRRYNGYDLEKGPVFYEPYYPENNENVPTEYQEKRYFDRDTVLERTFQIPPDRREYIEDQSKKEYADRLERVRYNGDYALDPKYSIEKHYRKIDSSRPYGVNRFLPSSVERTRDVPGDSSFSKDFESWNSLENYLHSDPYLGRHRNFDKSIVIGRSNFRAIPEHDQFLRQSNIFEKKNDDREIDTFREIRQNLAATSPRAIQPLEFPKDLESIKKLSPRNVQDESPFDSIDSIGYPRYSQEQYRYFDDANDHESRKWMSNVKSLLNRQMEAIPRTIELPSKLPLPSENIFAPRPQVISYLFSKDSIAGSTEKPMTMMEASKNEEPRNYGDNLLQEEFKRGEEEKDKSVKVTSIEISEAPKHKIRHHHGEWLREFPHGKK